VVVVVAGDVKKQQLHSNKDTSLGL